MRQEPPAINSVPSGIGSSVQPRESRLLAEAVLLGVIGALAAEAFLWALRFCGDFFLRGIAGYVAPGLPGEGGPATQHIGPHGLWLIPVATTLGGLISGFLVYGFAPEAEGHGTDTAVKAFHRAGGFIRTRVAPLKLVASAITIGSGGSAGREGPTALIGAGVGSIYATYAKRPDEERRLLVLMGMAAGLSAIFRSPIGTAFFAIEVLYGGMDLEAGALAYTMLSSIVAYGVVGLFGGWQPLFAFPTASPGPPHAVTYLWYGVLGLVAAPVATILPMVFYKLRDGFRSLPIPQTWKPALGGLGVGLVAWKFPQVLGGGYGWIQAAIDGHLILSLLVILIFAKMLAFALTVSSGGSGGVFAPTLFIGAMLGGCIAALAHQTPAPFAVIGMAAVFGAAARVPIASLIMVTEMTGSYRLFAPAAFAVLVAYLLQNKLSARLQYQSLYEAQVEGRAASPARYLDHIRIALDLLRKRRLPGSAKIGHLDLVALLDSGISIKLSGQRELGVGVLPPESALTGRPLSALYEEAGRQPLEVVAVLRRGEIVLPEPQMILEQGDRLLVISSTKTRDLIERHLGRATASVAQSQEAERKPESGNGGPAG